VIKIRVNATHAADFASSAGFGTLPPPAAAPVATPATVKVLDLFGRLQALPRQAVTFRLTEDEVNEYLIYALLKTPRPGIDSMTFKFFPHNYVSTLTVIDFDAIERWSPGLVPGFLELNGKKAIWIDVRFAVDKQALSYTVEKAFYQDKAIPHFLAEKIIQLVGSRQPEHVSGQAMAVPFGLTRIRTGEHFVEAEN
jgi:hypothetical protein